MEKKKYFQPEQKNIPYVWPDDAVYDWLEDIGAILPDNYRITIQRDDSGGGKVITWRYKRGEDGKLHADPETNAYPRHEPLVIKVDKIPSFVVLNLYGEILEMYGDDKVVLKD
ncbi:hypothetical protein ACFLTT_03125 [Chloroflexota bacterium]